jgi:DNA-binding XRE family transcriptional regulator
VTKSQRIVRARKKLKLNPAQFAKRLGVARSTVHGWEHGKPGPNLEHWRKIADVCEEDLVELMGLA